MHLKLTCFNHDVKISESVCDSVFETMEELATVLCKTGLPVTLVNNPGKTTPVVSVKASFGAFSMTFDEYTPRYVIRHNDGTYFAGIYNYGKEYSPIYPPTQTTQFCWSGRPSYAFVSKSFLESIQERHDIPGTIYELSGLPATN